MNITPFQKLNLLDPPSLEDVLHFTYNQTSAPAESITFDYSCLNEIKYASEWKHEDFNYTLNYYGFRMGKMPVDIDIGVFGCSFTFGTGMPVTGLWHTYMGNTLNQLVGNFGVPGLSALSVLDIFLIISKFVKIKKAVFLLPSFTRYQMAKKNPEDPNVVNYLNIIPNHDSKLCKTYGVDSLRIHEVISDEQLYKEVRNGIYISEFIGKKRNIEMFMTSWDRESYEFLEEMDFSHVKILPRWYHPIEIGTDTGRDKMHPGFKLNRFFAEQITPYLR